MLGILQFFFFLDFPGDFIFNNKLLCGSSTSQPLPTESHHRWRCLIHITSDNFLRWFSALWLRCSSISECVTWLTVFLHCYSNSSYYNFIFNFCGAGLSATSVAQQCSSTVSKALIRSSESIDNFVSVLLSSVSMWFS